jgi:hypothetical protein
MTDRFYLAIPAGANTNAELRIYSMQDGARCSSRKAQPSLPPFANAIVRSHLNEKSAIRRSDFNF